MIVFGIVSVATVIAAIVCVCRQYDVRRVCDTTSFSSDDDGNGDDTADDDDDDKLVPTAPPEGATLPAERCAMIGAGHPAQTDGYPDVGGGTAQPVEFVVNKIDESLL